MVVHRIFVAVAALCVASGVQLVQAQVTSNATCLTQYQWMDNSKGQNPCMASAYLSAECNGGQWNVPYIGADGPYRAPNGTSANLCRCNSVVYNLLAACSICQGGNPGNWVNWIENCAPANTTVGRYPLPIPAGVAIPSWAYLDFTQQDSFQVAAAQQYAASGTASPESASVAGQTQSQTAVGTATGTRGSTTGSTGLPTVAPISNGSSGGGSNTGAIVGGVVGGVLGLAVLGLIAWVLIRKKKQQQMESAPSEKYPATQPDSGYPVQQPYNAGHYAPVPAQNGAYNQGQGYVHPYGAPDTPGNAYKPYDPSDPSTFPTTPAPGGAPTVYSQGPTEYGRQPQPGQYNYAAEL